MQRDQAVRRGGVDDVLPEHAGADAGDPARRRRSRRRPCPDVLTQHRAARGRRAGRRCGRSPGAATRRPARARGAHDVGDLARVGRVGDGGGALVDGEVEGLARGVVAVVAGEGDGAAAEVAEGGQFIASGIDDRHGRPTVAGPRVAATLARTVAVQVSSASASSPWELAPSLRSALPSLISIDPRRDEQLLGDLALGAARGGERGDAPLGRGQRAHAARRGRARARRRRPASRCGSAPSRRSAPHTSASSCARVSGSRA